LEVKKGARKHTSLRDSDFDLEEDTPELEAELLKAVNGPHASLGDNELQEIAARAKAAIGRFSH
jgi:hypothetical protein